MLDQIVDIVKKKIGTRLIREAGLTEEQAKTSVELAGTSTATVLQEQVAKGDTSMLAELFDSQSATSNDNPIFAKIETLFLTKLSSIVGITGSKASTVKDMTLPLLLKTIGQQSEIDAKTDFSSLASLLQSSSFKTSTGNDSFVSKLGRFFRKS